MNTKSYNKKFFFISVAVLIAISAALALMTHIRNWVGMDPHDVFTCTVDLTCVMGIAIFYCCVPRTSIDDRRIKLILVIAVVIFASIFVDIMKLLYQGYPEYRNHVYACTILSMLLNNLCSFLFYCFARMISKANRHYGIPLALVWFGISGLLYITNPWHGLMFTVDENANIVRNMPWFYLYFAYPFIVQISGMVLAYKYKLSKSNKYMFFSFNVVPICVTILTMLVVNTDVNYASYTVAVLICYNVVFKELIRENSSIKDALGCFYSDEIVEHITDQSSGGALAPHKMNAAVMAVDVRGFTAISERIEAKSLVDMVNHFFGTLSEIVERNGGSVLEFLGDGFTAIFEDGNGSTKSELAVKTAIEIQNEVGNINKWNAEMGYPHIEAGIGIHTGEIIVGSYGSDTKSSFKIIGEDVDRALYMESQCVGGDIVISRNTLFDISCIADAEPIYANEIYRVYSLGYPYNVLLNRTENKMVELQNPYPISFRFFTGKRIDNDYKMGYITSISDREMVLKTDAVLSGICEIELLSVKYKFLYAKKVNSGSGPARFVFTSKPDNFSQWYKNVVSFTNKISISSEESNAS